METANPPWVSLSVHPTTGAHPAAGSRAVRAIDAAVEMHGSYTIFRYRLRGEVSRLRVPAEGHPERADGLWKHTCFEAFVRTPGGPGYIEFNVSPSRQWALYSFDSYRQGMSSPELAPPEISVQRLEDGIDVEAVLKLRHLMSPQDAQRLELALSAVIEEEDGTLSYWALKHAPDKPDFHFPGGFVLALGMQQRTV